MMEMMRIWVKHTMIHSDAILSNYLRIILGKEQNETPIAVVRARARVFCHSELIHPIKMRIMSHLVFSSYIILKKKTAHQQATKLFLSAVFPSNFPSTQLQMNCFSTAWTHGNRHYFLNKRCYKLRFTSIVGEFETSNDHDSWWWWWWRQ